MRKILVILILTALGMISPTLVLGQSKSDVLIKNATVMTAVKGTLENTDILIQNGKIAKIGKIEAHAAWGKEMEPYVVSGTSQWTIYRIVA